MYYGNSLANATSSAENTFSYASREQRYVLMGDYNQNYSYLIPFFDNTSYGVGVTTITQESSDIDTAARVSLGSAVLSENGTVVSSTKPIAISGAVVSSDMWAPFAWQSTDLVGFSYVANPEIEIYNPNQTSVSVGIYEQGALDDRSPNPFTVTARAIDDTTYSGVAGNWRASSTLPVMMYIEGGANRVVVVPTLAKEWWGHARNTRIAAGANAATFNIYCSNGSTGSGSVSAYSFTSNTTCNGTYGSISAYIVADQPVTVSAHADGNGSDSQVWYSKKDLDLVHISADDYEYLACTTPYANTTFEVFTISGGVWVSQTSGTATRTGSDPNPYWYRDYTTRSGGVKITSTNPSYCYVDRDVTSDESNISNIVINRQGTYPEPEVLLIEAQETPPASTNSPPTITQVSESADPTPAGQDLYWSVDWNDTDSGDLIKVVVCSTNSITTSTLACAATKYCQSPVYTNRDPEGLCYYTTQSPGTLNYYAFVCDNSGATNACSNGYAGSVTVEEQSPTAPSDLLTENRSQALNIDTLTPRFSAVFNDPNVQDTAIKYCIQVNSQSDFAGTDLWFSDGANCGAGNAITCSQGTRCPDITYAGTALTLNGNPYYWRINFVDSSHNTSTTSTVATFTMANSGTGVRLKGFNLKGGIRLK